MSYANFGPGYNTRTITNAAGALAVAVRADGDPTAIIGVIQPLGGGANIPLVVSEGTYIVEAGVTFDGNALAYTFQFGQLVLGVDGAIYAESAAIAGADFAAAGVFTIPFNVNTIVVVPPGATRSLTSLFYWTGLSQAGSLVAASGVLSATKISA